MMRKIILFVFIILSFKTILAGGYLLLIGGGSENDDSLAWNKIPYQWSVQKSQNKRVAVISYNTETNWIPDYFVSKCGAVFAKNFQINSASLANLQSTYDSLMTYDVIFFKGGDQYNYYNTYRNTKTQQAVQQKFNQGGVICGTSAGLAILSSIVYTAENSSAYSDECLENPNNSYITLEDNFLNMFPGYVFDSHFNDRGRLGRLVSFLANWQFSNNTMIKGVGLDERTAMTIDTNRIGTVYGTGAATLVEAYHSNTFSQNGLILKADSVKYIQLLHLSTINFNTGIVSGLSSQTTPYEIEENINTTLLLSGDDSQANNQLLLNEIASIGNLTDSLLIICNSAVSSNVTSFKNYLISKGVTNISILEGTQTNLNNIAAEVLISNAKKLIFMENQWYVLDYFLKNGTTGIKLMQKILNQSLTIAFIGDNIRFAGKSIIDNYLTANAVNNGSLQLKKGLGLLKSTILLPKVYNSSNMYINSAAGLPYTMLKDTITRGLLLYKNAFVKYYVNNNKTYLKVYGNYPVIMLKNQCGNYGFANQTGSATSSTIRNIAGFDKFLISVITNGDSLKLGNSVNYTYVDKINNSDNYNIFTDYNNDNLIVDNIYKNRISINLIDIYGRKKLLTVTDSELSELDISEFKKGVYIILIEDIKNKKKFSKKIII